MIFERLALRFMLVVLQYLISTDITAGHIDTTGKVRRELRVVITLIESELESCAEQVK
jgi:hypothetical protein